MDKQTLTRDIKKEVGSFPTTTDIAKYLRMSRDSARTLLAGLEYMADGKSKRYFAGDVAERIMSRRAI